MVGEPDDDMPRISSLLKGRRDIVWLHTVSESLKAVMFKTCDAFVYLSEYEGFGLPVAEAMLARVPVVIPKTPARVEVSGGMAVQVDANPVAVSEGIAAAVLETATPTLDRAHQVATGYSWDATAAQTMEIYRVLASGTRQ
jgi:glycosyltransferase involved in cell wall biosynthesis